MAMNEDSVVSSLNELRRMANDRARREAAERARADAERRAYDDGRRSAPRGTQGRPRQTTGYGGQDLPVVQQTEAYGHAQYQPQVTAYSHQSVTPDWNQAQTPRTHAVTEPVVRARKSAAGPVLVTMVLAGIAMGAGYYKLTAEHKVQLERKDAKIAELEKAKGDAVEAASRAEQQAKVTIAKAAEKPAAALPPPAAAPAAAGVPPAAAAAVPPAAKPASAVKPSGKLAAKRFARAARSRRQAAAAARAERALAPLLAAPKEEKEKKPAALPGIAKKKKVNDDPLDGLKL